LDVSKYDILRAKDDIVEGLTKGQRLRLSQEAERELGKRDTYYLTKHILQYDQLNNRFHLALCRHHDLHYFKCQLQLHPRKHFKTTIITIGGNVRFVLNDPDTTICIICNTLANSSDILKELKAHFIGNDKFKALYPEHAVHFAREEGTHDKFTTPARTKVWERMATVEAASADKAIVSRHYRKLHFDDIVDDKNTATAELTRKIYDNYTTSLSTTSLTKDGLPWHHIVGTRWSFDDPYSKILAENEETQSYEVFITRAYSKKRDSETGANKTVYLFPEKFPPRALDVLKKKQGPYRFSCLYLNSPVPGGEAALDPSFLQPFSLTSKLPSPLNRIITVDPSPSTDVRKGDPTCISAFGIDRSSNLYILAVELVWETPDLIIERILDMHKASGIREIGIESVSFSKWLCFYVERAVKEQGLRLKVIPIKRSDHLKKMRRHERIIPYLRNSKIFIDDQMENSDHVRQELREYPMGRHDHFLDCLTDGIEELVKRIPAKRERRTIGCRIPPRVYDTRRGFQTGYSIQSSRSTFRSDFLRSDANLADRRRGKA
jgi:predicted phage terminase large subunit-like protein